MRCNIDISPSPVGSDISPNMAFSTGAEATSVTMKKFTATFYMGAGCTQKVKLNFLVAMVFV